MLTVVKENVGQIHYFVCGRAGDNSSFLIPDVHMCTPSPSFSFFHSLLKCKDLISARYESWCTYTHRIVRHQLTSLKFDKQFSERPQILIL
jgi:hypothetical protein